MRDTAALFEKARLIVKVKEPLPPEYNLLHPEQMLFTFFHFSSNRELTLAMLSAQATCVAYETVETDDGRVPLLAPMSEIAGKMAPMMAAIYLAKPCGGKGVLASSVEHVAPARFVILGGGSAGRAAAAVALGIGAEVVILERFQCVIDKLRKLFPAAVCVPATPENIAQHVAAADALIGAVHMPGAPAPKIVSRNMVAAMEQGSVIVDIAIDQGGCIETSRPTTHSDPVYVAEGVIHYCVTNMPGVFSRTATYALTSVCLPYALALANSGLRAFKNQELLRGLNMYKGKITNRRVAEAHGLPWTDPEELLG
jgi:alanine dehydrogenase